MQNKQEYKQAILVGAAPIGEEGKRLVSLLRWARGSRPAMANAKDADCSGNCGGCRRECEMHKDVYLIAVDGGIGFLFENDIKPDLWIGDMDSVSEQVASLDWDSYRSSIAMERFPVQKDDTDMALAATKAYEKGYREILIYGGFGGTRLSHTFANIQLMQHYESKGCHIRLVAASCQAEVLVCGVKHYSAMMRGNISIICLSNRAEEVVIEGLQYEYRGALTNTAALGVSNAFVGKEATVSVEQGALLLLYEK